MQWGVLNLTCRRDYCTLKLSLSVLVSLKTFQMIESALRKSSDEGGSSEASISQFIKEKYNGLPWAHPTLLKHHLQKQCEYGCIVPTLGNKYMLVGVDSGPNSESDRKWLRRPESVWNRSRRIFVMTEKIVLLAILCKKHVHLKGQ